MNGWIILSIALFPLLVSLIFFTYKEYKVIKGKIQIKKTKLIRFDSYEEVELNEVPVDYRIPRGQKAYLVMDLKNVSKAQSQRMYTGHTKGGIRFPFFTLSTQRKRFYQQGEYIPYGNAKVIVTNRLIRIQGQPFKWLYNLSEIEQLVFIDDNKTLELSLMKGAWPIKLNFNSKDDMELFLNTVWTSFHGRKKKDEK